MMTAAPARASARAIERPMPRLAPVISATLFDMCPLPLNTGVSPTQIREQRGSRFFGDHGDGQIGVGTHQRWHDGAVNHTQAAHAMDAALGVYDGLRIVGTALAARAGGMPHRPGETLNERLQRADVML